MWVFKFFKFFNTQNSVKLKNNKQVENSANNKKKSKEININSNLHYLTYMDYIEKDVEQDGNCYYRCLSYYYRNTENYH